MSYLVTVGDRTGTVTARKLTDAGIALWSVDHGNNLWAVTTDREGNVYVGGERSNTIAATYASHRKYDAAGTLLWSADHGLTVSAIAVDTNGNVYTGGYRGAGSGNETTRKYDSDGNLLWSADHGAWVACIAVDATGNVYTGGQRTNAVGSVYATTRKYDTNGNLLWSVDHGNSSVKGIAVDSAGNVYTGGDLGTPGYTTRKYDSSGNLLWSKNHGSTVTSLDVDASGNVYTGGWQESGVTTRAYDTNGTPLWTADHGTYVYGISVDSAGNVYTGGERIDDKTTRKYNSAGTLVWSVDYGADVRGVVAYAESTFGGGGVVRGRRVPEFTVSFLRRDFTGGIIAPRCTFRPTLMSWAALGGCDLATVVATGSEGALWDLADMLRCPVQIIDQDGQFAWWGYVAAVNIDFGQLSFGVNLDSMANRVAVAYADQGSGITTSSRATTDWEEDAESVAEYGSFERLESLSDAGSTEAEARRDALLEALKWPVPEIDFGSRGLTGTLTCRGWWHALKRRYYANEGTTDVETTEQIEDIIADVGSEFFTGCVIQDTSGISTNEYRDGDSNAWQIIQDLLQSGVAAASVRLLANVDITRTLEVYQEPVPGASDGRLYPSGEMTDGHGASIRIGPGLVGRHARLADVIPPYVNLARVADPSRVFIERAEYDVERVRLRPQPRGSSVYQVSRVEAG